LYVSDYGILWRTDPGEGGNTISIIDLGRRERVGVIELGSYRRPHGMAFHPRFGRLTVTVQNPDALLLLDPLARKVIRKYDTKGRSSHMVTLGPGDEWAYVSNAASNDVSAIHLESGATRLIPTDGRPQGGVLSRDGKLLYIVNSDGNSISIIDTSKQERVGAIATGKGPTRIALSADGNQLIYNLQVDNAVAFADPKSRKQTAAIPLEGPPLSMSLSPDGKRAYTAVESLDRVYVISIGERRVMNSFSTPSGAAPEAVMEVRLR